MAAVLRQLSRQVNHPVVNSDGQSDQGHPSRVPGVQARLTGERQAWANSAISPDPIAQKNGVR